MYTIIAVGIGIVIGIFITWRLERYDTQEYRRNFKRNLDAWNKKEYVE